MVLPTPLALAGRTGRTVDFCRGMLLADCRLRLFEVVTFVVAEAVVVGAGLVLVEIP